MATIDVTDPAHPVVVSNRDGEGVITVEGAKGTQTEIEVVQGMRFDRGYSSPYFVTDPERMECVLQDPVILIHERRIASMKDLLPLLEYVAILTGGQLIAEETGLKLEHVKPAELGRASRVVVKQEDTTIVGGAGDKRAIAGHVEQLRRQIRETKSDYDREKLEERLAKLLLVLDTVTGSDAERLCTLAWAP